jgi:hypothetical protein
VDEALTTLPARARGTQTDVGVEPRPRARRWPRAAAIVALGLVASFATWKLATRRATLTFTPGAAALWAGGWHDCALRYQRLVCWGSNSKGQLGQDHPESSTPVPVSLDGVRSVAWAVPPARSSPTAVFCWGRNVRGEVRGRR